MFRYARIVREVAEDMLEATVAFILLAIAFSAFITERTTLAIVVLLRFYPSSGKLQCINSMWVLRDRHKHPALYCFIELSCNYWLRKPTKPNL